MTLMFKRNTGYQQKELFGFESNLTKKQSIYLKSSTEFTFFNEIFHKIDENDFSLLYSSTKSRPNVPINQLVGALILKHLNNWTCAELFKNLTFNSLTRYSIGITDPTADIFSEATMFNFQNRVIKHYEVSGQDLITEVFDSLTANQLKQFEINTSIQRGDSFLVGSKVIDYSRLRLFIEVLKRLSRVLEGDIKKQFYCKISQYDKTTAGQYVYQISKEELPQQLNKIATIYFEINELIKDYQNDCDEIKNFRRVYDEYFIVDDKKISVKPTSALKSDDLNSPDDPEATFSAKYGRRHVGYSTHLSETINPENNINLITDVVVVKNNLTDDRILEARIPKLKKKTPSLSEYFTDGAYGSEQVDLLNKEHNITQYQTGVKGRKSEANVRINKEGEHYTVSCGGGQTIEAISTEKGYKVVFDPEICKNCPLKDLCKLKKQGGQRMETKRHYYFRMRNILAHERIQNVESLPPERRHTRSNVEATVKELKRGMQNGKVRVRHWIRVSLHMIFTAISVNLRRIHMKIKGKNSFLEYSLLEKLVILVYDKKISKYSRLCSNQ